MYRSPLVASPRADARHRPGCGRLPSPGRASATTAAPAQRPALTAAAQYTNPAIWQDFAEHTLRRSTDRTIAPPTRRGEP